MASSKDIEAGRGYIRLGLNDSVSKDLDKIGAKLKSFGASITSIGARIGAVGTLGVTSLIGAVKLFADAGSEINDAMAKTGLSAKMLEEMKYAAEQTGASFDDVQAAARGLNKVFGEAVEGSAEAKAAFGGLGLSVEQLKGMSQDTRMQAVIDGLTKIKDPALRAATAMQVLGKGGTALLGALGEFEEQRKRLASLGTIIPDDQIAAADRLGDSLHDLYLQVMRVVYGVGAAVGQALQPFFDASVSIFHTVIQWVDANRPLLIGLLAIAGAVAAAGGALVGLGLTFTVVGTALTGVASALGLVAGLIGFMLQPAVLVAGAVAALAGYFAIAGENGEAVISYLSNLFQFLKATALETFGGIADALAAGNISLAAQVLWAGLKLAWAEGTQGLMTTWYEFRAAIIGVAVSAFYGVQEAWANVSAALQEAWAIVNRAFAAVWDSTVGVIVDAFQYAVLQIQKGINDIKGWWDDAFDSDKANDALQKTFDDNKAARRKAEIDSESKRETTLPGDLAKIEAEKKALIAQLDAKDQAIQDANVDVANSDIDKLQQEKADLQKQLDALAGKGKDEKAKLPERPSLIDPSKQADLDDLLKSRNAASSPSKALGSFSADAIRAGALSGNFQDRIAKATEATAKNTGRLARQKTTFG